MIILDGFTNLPETATVAGAPIEALTAKAFRENDALFERILQSLMCSPFMSSAAMAVGDSNNVVVNSDSFAHAFLNVKTINVTAKCTLKERVPLIWMARESIIINEEIDGSGKGAAAGTSGDFGGSGGGGASVGGSCFMPLSAKIVPDDRLLEGGAIGAAGQSVVESWQLSRAFLHLAWLIGGAGGADAGGAGGGVVCLCAPSIELKGNGKINVAGKTTTADNTGGGGGGLVILIAQQIINAVEGTTILINGGVAAAVGSGTGGTGKLIQHVFK